jgi:guanylate kinase
MTSGAGTEHPAPLPAPLVVVSGPSGVGKTTVVEQLIRESTVPLRRAVTATTRQPRPGEIDGTSYHFWTHNHFRSAVDDGRMLEWELVFDSDYYGTPRSEVDPYRAAGLGVVLVIDVKGASRVRTVCPDCLSVFIAPPSFEVLEARLRRRNDLEEGKLLRRLQTARLELARAGEFDHIIVNDEVPRAVRELDGLIREHCRRRGKTDA